MTELLTPVSRDLIDAILEEHHRAVGCMNKTLDHMIACGRFLMQAQQEVPKGTWGKWVAEELGIHRKTVSGYIRFARHADVLQAKGVTTATGAREILQMLDVPRANSAEHFASEAKRMRQEGKSVQSIADHFGVSHARVSQWIDREKFMKSARKAQAKRNAAMKLLEQRENAKSIKKSGKELSEAYAHVRKALAALSSLQSDKTSEHTNRAIYALYRAEDHITKASKES